MPCCSKPSASSSARPWPRSPWACCSQASRCPAPSAPWPWAHCSMDCSITCWMCRCHWACSTYSWRVEMETLNFLMQGFDVATRPTNLLVALFDAFVGTIVGLLPGLGPINGVALLLPLDFALGLPPETALILLAPVSLGCEYGWRISAILLNVPGDAAAVMTPLDGYPLARQGKAGIE